MIVRLVAAALALAGFALTLRVFWPGLQTFDAGYVYDSIKAERFGDWQSPMMAIVWSLVDPVAPGAASMLLLTASLYWGAFGLLGWAFAKRSRTAALLLPLLALTPPAFVFVGVIWRDMLFAVIWLFGAALVFAAAEREKPLRVAAQAIALGLLGLGVLLRPNAIFAAPLLAVYVLWPARFSWRRAALLLVPMAAAFALLIQLVYYGILDAKRQHPLHSLLVFDLGGITHFTKDNQFPVAWTGEQRLLLAESCYKPELWDVYWYLEPCRFVMERLEADRLFGAPALAEAWRRAVTAHPLAYLQHRATFFWTFLAGANPALPLDDIAAQTRAAWMQDAFFRTLVNLHDALQPTLLFRVGFWLAALLAVCGWAWPLRETPPGAFALALGTCALVYLLTFFAVGVAVDFRYAYWPVLAAVAAAAAIPGGRRPVTGCTA